MSNESNQMTKWDHFTGQWLRTVRTLRRDASYCRLALAMALADEQREDWPYYLSLAQTWKGVWDDRENDALQRRCAKYAALGWSFEVNPAGFWMASAPGIESSNTHLTIVLANVRDSAQPLREEWERHYNKIKARREAVSQ